MKQRASDRTLRRWLSTGRPARVARLADADSGIAARLDALTGLTKAENEALENLVTPRDEFEQRTTVGVQHRIDNYDTTATMVDLLGLGFHVGRAVLGRGKSGRIDPKHDDERERHEP